MPSILTFACSPEVWQGDRATTSESNIEDGAVKIQAVASAKVCQGSSPLAIYLQHKLGVTPYLATASWVIVAILVSLVFSLETLMVRALSDIVKEAMELITIIGGLKFLVLIISARINGDIYFNGYKNAIPIFLATASLFATFQAMLYISLSLVPLVDVIAYYYLIPLVLALLYKTGFKSALCIASLSGMLLCIAGVVLVSRPSFLTTAHYSIPDKHLGIVLSLCSSLAAAVGYKLTNSVPQPFPPVLLAISAHFIQFLTGTVFMATSSSPITLVYKNFFFYILLVLLLIFGFLGEAMVASVCKDIRLGSFMAVESSQMLWLLLWGCTIVNDHLSWTSLIGVIAIITGLLTFESKEISKFFCFCTTSAESVKSNSADMLNSGDKSGVVVASSAGAPPQKTTKTFFQRVKGFSFKRRADMDETGKADKNQQNMFISNPTWNMMESCDWAMSQTESIQGDA